MQFNNGEHGFDNGVLDMKTIFRAVGPSFRRGLEVEPFESVHVYELLCRLLGIAPEANDGDPGALLPMLTPEATGGTSAPPTTTPSGEAPPSACTGPSGCRRSACPGTGAPATWGACPPCPGVPTQRPLRLAVRAGQERVQAAGRRSRGRRPRDRPSG